MPKTVGGKSVCDMFKVPSFAAQPSLTASISVRISLSSIRRFAVITPTFLEAISGALIHLSSWSPESRIKFSELVHDFALQVIHQGQTVEEIEIDRKPFYIFGTARDCDFLHPTFATAPPKHFAALVHHSDSRLFLIDLDSVIPSFVPTACFCPHIAGQS